MKKKLLITSALAGVMISGSAFAETKITGSLEYSYSMNSESTASTGTGALGSNDGFGSETQINIANSGDLNVGGLKYAAGFSIESDTTPDAFENFYIDISNASGTTLSMGADHFQPLDGTVTPRVSIAADSLDPEGGALISYQDQAGLDLVESQGIGISQKLGNVGTVGYWHARRSASAGSSTANDNYDTSANNSGYEINFKGNLGVDGLTVLLGKSDSKKLNSATVSDTEGRSLGASYNFGKFAVGYTEIKNEASTGIEINSDEFGVTFAVNDNLSIGVMYMETETVSAAGVTDPDEEEIYMIQAGYNMGGVAVAISYADVQDALHAAGNDHELASIRLLTKF